MLSLFTNLRTVFQEARRARSDHRFDLFDERKEAVDPIAELDRFALRTPLRQPAAATEEFAPLVAGFDCRRYRSSVDLRTQWKQLDQPDDALKLTVMLLLDEHFQGYLPGLVRRTHHALRLAITSSTGHLPGLITPADLALHASSLGWHIITFHRRPEDAVKVSSHPLTWHERRILFYPASLTPASNRVI